MKALALLAVVAVLGSAVPVMAQQKDAMAGAPVVRRQINWRAERSELMPQLGLTMNDPYFKNILVGVGYNYHATGWLSFGANVGYAFGIKTSLTEDIESEKSGVEYENEDGELAKGPSFAMPATHVGLLADAHVGIVPLYGKMLLMGEKALAYDFHLTGGFGLVQVLWNSDLPSSFDAVDEFRTGPVFGGGVRLFVDDAVAIGIDVLDYFVTMHVVAEKDPDRAFTECRERPLDCYRVPDEMDWTHNVVAMVSFAIFMPGELTYEE